MVPAAMSPRRCALIQEHQDAPHQVACRQEVRQADDVPDRRGPQIDRSAADPHHPNADVLLAGCLAVAAALEPDVVADREHEQEQDTDGGQGNARRGSGQTQHAGQAPHNDGDAQQQQKLHQPVKHLGHRPRTGTGQLQPQVDLFGSFNAMIFRPAHGATSANLLAASSQGRQERS